MIIKVFDKNMLDEKLCKECLTLTKRRFKTRWGINRNDITISLIQNRINAIAFRNNEVVGVLGMEETGELVNGCAKEDINGIYLLSNLAKEIVKFNNKSAFLYFAYFPNTDLAIPLSSFLATKGYLAVSNEVVTKKYNAHIILLKKIELFTKQRITKTELYTQLKIN